MTNMLLAGIVVGIAIGFLVGIAIVFISTFLTHIFIKLFGGKGKYADTFRAYAYGMTPNYIFGTLISITFSFLISSTIVASSIGTNQSALGNIITVFIINLILMIAVLIWSLIIEIRILSKVHKISGWRVFFAMLVLYLVLVAVIFVIFGLAYLSTFFLNVPMT